MEMETAETSEKLNVSTNSNK